MPVWLISSGCQPFARAWSDLARRARVDAHALRRARRAEPAEHREDPRVRAGLEREPDAGGDARSGRARPGARGRSRAGARGRTRTAGCRARGASASRSAPLSASRPSRTSRPGRRHQVGAVPACAGRRGSSRGRLLRAIARGPAARRWERRPGVEDRAPGHRVRERVRALGDGRAHGLEQVLGDVGDLLDGLAERLGVARRTARGSR